MNTKGVVLGAATGDASADRQARTDFLVHALQVFTSLCVTGVDADRGGRPGSRLRPVAALVHDGIASCRHRVWQRTLRVTHLTTLLHTMAEELVAVCSGLEGDAGSDTDSDFEEDSGGEDAAGQCDASTLSHILAGGNSQAPGEAQALVAREAAAHAAWALLLLRVPGQDDSGEPPFSE